MGFDVFYFFEVDIIVFLDKRIESILDFVFRTASDLLADLRPFASNFAVEF